MVKEFILNIGFYTELIIYNDMVNFNEIEQAIHELQAENENYVDTDVYMVLEKFGKYTIKVLDTLNKIYC